MSEGKAMRMAEVRSKWIGLAAKLLSGALTAVVIMLILIFSLKILSRPSGSGTLSITAATGSLTLEPLCGESVTWDLPAGRVGRRSVAPGEPGYETSAEAVTMVLAPGSRTRVISSDARVLRVSVEQTDDLAQRCPAVASQPYRLILDGAPAAQDPVGFNYEARAQAEAGPLKISLPVSGRVILGQVVSEGADWRARSAPILLTGAIMRRVKPWFSDEVMTVGETERLDQGSILDSHACMEPRTSSIAAAPGCSAAQLVPAVGFFQILDAGGLQVQLYARGPAGVQNYRGPQHRIEVPLSTALWESDTVKVWGAFFLLIFACLEQVSRVCKSTWTRILHSITKRSPDKAATSDAEPAPRAIVSDRTPAAGGETAVRSSAAEAFHEIERLQQTNPKKTNI